MRVFPIEINFRGCLYYLPNVKSTNMMLSRRRPRPRFQAFFSEDEDNDENDRLDELCFATSRNL